MATQTSTDEWNQIEENLEEGYEDRIVGGRNDLDVGTEAIEAMEKAGFLHDEGIEYFDEAMEADLQEGAIAAVNQTPDDDYILFVDEEEFYTLYDESGLIEAAEAMRHEYNHARDFEGDLLPDLREEGDIDPITAYIIGLNLEGSREEMEGANQYVTKLENPYDVVTELEAYPEETQDVADQIKEYIEEASEDVKAQLEEQGLEELSYDDSDIDVYDVEIEDGKYVERGEIDGEEYEIELDMPEYTGEAETSQKTPVISEI